MKNSKKNLLNFGSRTFILTAALIVILGGVISGTVAWMFIKSDPVHNTFSYGDMKIELTETDTGLDEDQDDDTNSYSLTPEAEIAKDPMVTVKSEDVDCWVFVEIDKSDDFDAYLEYQLADGWKALDAAKYPGIYYMKVSKSEDEQKFSVLEGNIVKVKEDVTQQMLDEMGEDYPNIGFTAFAIQLTDLDKAEDAWKAVNDK